MKVLYIVTAYPRHEGDVITPWLVETIRRLRSRGVTVEVLAPAYRDLRSHYVEGVRVHRFRYAPRAWQTLTHDQTAPDRMRERPLYLGLVPSYVLAGSLAAARLARSGQFNLLHAFWPVPHGLLGLAAKRASGLPLISTFFGVELTWIEARMRFLRPALRAIVRGSDAVTAISSYTAAKLQALAPGTRPLVIPFSAAIEPPSDIEVGRRPGPFRLLFVGRLVERKGVHVLLDAVARLRETREIHLAIVGEGPERDALEARRDALGIEGQVDFDGLLPPAELSRRLAACDALVLPAVRDAKGDTEGLGVVLLEALTYGKPVIGSDIGGIPDIIRHGETGLLVPPGDAEALAAAVGRYVGDPALAAAHAAAGRAHAERNFSWTAIVDRLRALYLAVLERKAHGASEAIEAARATPPPISGTR